METMLKPEVGNKKINLDYYQQHCPVQIDNMDNLYPFIDPG